MTFYCLILYQVQGHNRCSPMGDICLSFSPLTRGHEQDRELETPQWHNANMLVRNDSLKVYMEK